MLSVFMTPWMKPTSIHRAISEAWASTTHSKNARYGFSASRACGIMACDRVVGQTPHERSRRRRRAAYWKVPTRMWLAATRVSTAPGSSVSRATCSPVATTASARVVGNAERVHRLADHVLAQHRADRRLSVSASREWRATRALQVQVAPAAADVDHLADQQRSSVAESRREAAELMAGVGLRHRRRPGRRVVAYEEGDTVGRPQRIGIDAQLSGQCLVERQQAGRRSRARPPRHAQVLELTGIGVLEGEQRWGGDAHCLQISS